MTGTAFAILAMFYKNLFFSIYSEVLCAKGKEALSKEQHFLIKFQQKFELFSNCQTQRLVSDLWRPNQIYQEMLRFRQKEKITVDISHFYTYAIWGSYIVYTKSAKILLCKNIVSKRIFCWIFQKRPRHTHCLRIGGGAHFLFWTLKQNSGNWL